MATSAPSIGTIVALTGHVFLETESGLIPLSQGDAITKGATIITKDDGRVEIRFEDNTVLSQAENSRISIDEYVYDKDNADASQFLLDMAQGTLRTVTGKIAEQNPDEFKVKSPLATIGIRGTEFWVVSDEHGDKVYLGDIASGHIMVVQDNFGTVRFMNTTSTFATLTQGSPMGPLRQAGTEELQQLESSTPMTSLPTTEDTTEENGGEGEQEVGSAGDADNALETAQAETDQILAEDPAAQDMPDNQPQTDALFQSSTEDETLPSEQSEGLPSKTGDVFSHHTSSPATADFLAGNTSSEEGIGEHSYITNEDNEQSDTMDFSQCVEPNDDTPALEANLNDNYATYYLTQDSHASTGTTISAPSYGTRLDGINNIIGSATGKDIITGNNEANTFWGQGGGDILNGAGGNDTLYGGLGNDQLVGGADDDTLVGGAGDDWLTGGDGADTFLYESSADFGDTIKDFAHGTDKIHLSQSCVSQSNIPTGALQSTYFNNNYFFTINASSTELELYYASDGNGSSSNYKTVIATFEATAGTLPTIDEMDIVIVN